VVGFLNPALLFQMALSSCQDGADPAPDSVTDDLAYVVRRLNLTAEQVRGVVLAAHWDWTNHALRFSTCSAWLPPSFPLTPAGPRPRQR